jgi:Predicted membrane protein
MSKWKWTNDEIAEYRKNHTAFIYFNKEDLNFLVPKTYGVGWRFNWANPISWGFAVIVIGLFIWKLFFK